MLICSQDPAFTPPAPITAPLFGAGDQQRPQQHQQQQPSPVGRYLCVTPTVPPVISTPLSHLFDSVLSSRNASRCSPCTRCASYDASGGWSARRAAKLWGCYPSATCSGTWWLSTAITACHHATPISCNNCTGKLRSTLEHLKHAVKPFNFN